MKSLKKNINHHKNSNLDLLERLQKLTLDKSMNDTEKWIDEIMKIKIEINFKHIITDDEMVALLYNNIPDNNHFRQIKYEFRRQYVSVNDPLTVTNLRYQLVFFKGS